MEENKKVHIHEESGLQYYEIKLTATEDESKDITIRLFESTAPGRLDFETHDEYQVRRKYMNNIKTDKIPDLVWNASWGPLNEHNALRVQAELSEGKQPTPWAFHKHQDKYHPKDRLAVANAMRKEAKAKAKAEYLKNKKAKHKNKNNELSRSR